MHKLNKCFQNTRLFRNHEMATWFSQADRQAHRHFFKRDKLHLRKCIQMYSRDESRLTFRYIDMESKPIVLLSFLSYVRPSVRPTCTFLSRFSKSKLQWTFKCAKKNKPRYFMLSAIFGKLNLVAFFSKLFWP